MFTFGTRPPKKCASDPRALFSVSRSISFTGILFKENHSAKPTIMLVFPTPPFPPIERMTLFFTSQTVSGDGVLGSSGLFISALLCPTFLCAGVLLHPLLNLAFQPGG